MEYALSAAGNHEELYNYYKELQVNESKYMNLSDEETSFELCKTSGMQTVFQQIRWLRMTRQHRADLPLNISFFGIRRCSLDGIPQASNYTNFPNCK